MIRDLVLFGLCLALTGPAVARPGLSPAVKAAERPAPPAEAPAPGAGLQAPAPRLNLSAQAADQCRAACAQSYYFCLAGDSPEACPDAWSQCRLGCRSPQAASSRLSPQR